MANICVVPQQNNNKISGKCSLNLAAGHFGGGPGGAGGDGGECGVTSEVGREGGAALGL